MLNPDQNLHLERATTLAIRRAVKADLTSIHEMIEELCAHHGDKVSIEKSALEQDLFSDLPWLAAFVAETEGKLVGYTILTPTYRPSEAKRGMEVHHLYVKPEYRARGIGQHLLQKARNHAARNGCAFLTLSAATGNFAAYRFYEGQGFSAKPVTGMRFRSSI